jgi:diguanylate cyclase (GGDEF)-like protein/PAS domain S-box-containing protein
MVADDDYTRRRERDTAKAFDLGERAHIGWDGIAGFVVIMNAVPLRYLEELRAVGKPVVMISRAEPSFVCPSVLPDNFGGASEAVRHLWLHGHRDIAFVGDTTQCDIRERYEAYRETLCSLGAGTAPERLFRASDNLETGGRAATEAMLAAGALPTAVFAATDLNARGVMAALLGAGHVVPQDLAVVGFDDIPDSALMSPALTSVAQRFDELGAMAAELLYRRLDGQEVPPTVHRVSTSLVLRESCGCTEGPSEQGSRERAGPVEGFADALAAVVCPAGADEATVREISEVADEIRCTFERAAAGQLSPLELAELGQACERLHGEETLPGTFVVALSLAWSLAYAVERRAVGPEAVPQVGRCMRAVSLGLLKTGLRCCFPWSVWARPVEDLVSFELLKAREDPCTLEWLAGSKASVALLALWAPGGGGPPELEVVGQFDSRGGTPYSGPVRMAPEAFPVAELASRAAGKRGEVLCVLPVKAGVHELGFIALAGPVEDDLAGRDSYFHWSVLLGLVLELRRSKEDLAVLFGHEREMAQAVRASEERYALAARAANDGLWDWDLVNGTVYYSARWKEILAYPEDAVADSPEERLGRVHPDDLQGLLALIDERRREATGAFEHEHRARAADGTYRWVLCRGLGVPGAGGEAVRLVGSLTDVTQRRSLQDQLEHQALHDSLTGLPNRRLFMDRLSQAMAVARGNPARGYAVLWLDLDGFKVVNDSLGHSLGDVLLQQVADRLRAYTRGVGTAARFGGDEFALLLQDAADLASVEGAVRRLQGELTEPYDVDGHRVAVTASVGVFVGGSGQESPEDVLRDVDAAMYRAKAAGGAAFVALDAAKRTSVASKPARGAVYLLPQQDPEVASEPAKRQ